MTALWPWPVKLEPTHAVDCDLDEDCQCPAGAEEEEERFLALVESIGEATAS